MNEISSLIRGFIISATTTALMMASVATCFLILCPQTPQFTAACSDVITFWHLCGALGYNVYYKLFGAYPLKHLLNTWYN